MDRINNKLSGDPTALVLGIISLVIVVLGCCCGLFTIGSLTLSIIALVMAAKSIREYAAEPENYSVASYKNMNTAKVIGIVGIVLSGLILVGQIAFFAINGEKFSREFWEEFQRNGNAHREWDWDSDSDSDKQSDSTY